MLELFIHINPSGKVGISPFARKMNDPEFFSIRDVSRNLDQELQRIALHSHLPLIPERVSDDL